METKPPKSEFDSMEQLFLHLLERVVGEGFGKLTEALSAVLRREFKAALADSAHLTLVPRAEVGRVWLTVQDVAAMVSTHEDTVRSWVHDGSLKACRVGKGAAYRIKRDEVDRFMEERRVSRDANEVDVDSEFDRIVSSQFTNVRYLKTGG